MPTTAVQDRDELLDLGDTIYSQLCGKSKIVRDHCLHYTAWKVCHAHHAARKVVRPKPYRLAAVPCVPALRMCLACTRAYKPH